MLRNFGVRIGIDDFGIGYSSLYHLYKLRFDKLKIDKHFIEELGSGEENELFLRAMIGLSHGLDLCVAAEGVETDAQVEALSLLGRLYTKYKASFRQSDSSRGKLRNCCESSLCSARWHDWRASVSRVKPFNAK